MTTTSRSMGEARQHQLPGMSSSYLCLGSGRLEIALVTREEEAVMEMWRPESSSSIKRIKRSICRFLITSLVVSILLNKTQPFLFHRLNKHYIATKVH